MNKQFADRLEAYLSSEINDYGLTYSWEWCEDTGCCVVKIERDYMPKRGMYVNFKWNGFDLMIELSEDSYHVTREWDHTVKYLWMLVGKKLMYG